MLHGAVVGLPVEGLVDHVGLHLIHIETSLNAREHRVVYGRPAVHLERYHFLLSCQLDLSCGLPDTGQALEKVTTITTWPCLAA